MQLRNTQIQTQLPERVSHREEKQNKTQGNEVNGFEYGWAVRGRSQTTFARRGR